MTIVLSIVLASILVLAGLLLAWSPGRTEPILDEAGRPLAGSISEKIFVDINGVKQGMFIKSKDASSPVLLYLHGGMPDYFLSKKYPTGMEDLFTVVWWEQRGSGLSYSADIPRETLNLEQMVADTIEVTNYLRARFGKEKIYLMGHSGGTFIGIHAATKAPELYHAYIGVAQMANQIKSEKLAYDYMLAQFKASGDTASARKLEAAPVTLEGVPQAYLMQRDFAMHSLGVGTMHEMKSVVSGIILESWQSRDYTLGEKFNLWTGKARSGVAALFDTMLHTNLAETLPEVPIPVYFLHGVYDYTCAYSVAKEYYAALRAPVKGFYTFQASAHSPMFEEPEKVRKILREDVLAGKNSLADSE